MKGSFHFWSLSSCLAAFSFAFEVFFLLLTSFTIFHTIHDCLSSTEFLILFIWPWMYSSCSYLVCVSSLWAFLSFCILAFVGFLSLSNNAIFILCHFFLTTCWPPWNATFGSWFSWYALSCCFYVGSDKVFIFVIQSICFRYPLKSIEFDSYNYCIFMLISLLVSEG